jgi:hypothetical protein
VAKRVKDYIEISEHTSLERLIDYLQTIRDSLPEHAEPELRIRGDDVFGRRLTISYLRDLSDEEAELEKRYTPPGELDAEDEPADEEMDALQKKLDEIPWGAVYDI